MRDKARDHGVGIRFKKKHAVKTLVLAQWRRRKWCFARREEMLHRDRPQCLQKLLYVEGAHFFLRCILSLSPSFSLLFAEVRAAVGLRKTFPPKQNKQSYDAIPERTNAFSTLQKVRTKTEK